MKLLSVATLLFLASPVFAESELCTYGTGADHDLRRWLHDGERYPPFLCAQSIMDDVRFPERHVGKDPNAWKHPEVIIVDNLPKEPVKTRPSIIEMAAGITARAMRDSVAKSGYTLVGEPAVREIALDPNPPAELRLLLTRQGCYKYATKLYTICVTIAETQPAMGTGPKPAKPKSKVKPSKKKAASAPTAASGAPAPDEPPRPPSRAGMRPAQ